MASRALTEEVEYGIGSLGLPVIVCYPDGDPIRPDGSIEKWARELWGRVPAFVQNMGSIPTAHVPMRRDAIRKALEKSGFTVQQAYEPGCYRLDWRGLWHNTQ